MLSGWSTHGVLSCPICMDQSKAFYLKEGRKPSFFDCHRQFLPSENPFRKDRKSFKKGKVEKSSPPRRLSGEGVLEKVCHFPSVMEKIGTNKLSGFGDEHNWTKWSIFWELPYWHTNLIRHNLDVMYIEKNMFDNIFNTVMDVNGKTKDNINARKDLSLYCNCPNYELKINVDGKISKPIAPYTLGKEKKKMVCEWVTNLRLSDGYASNLSKCVDIQALQMSKMKSHDCYVFMEKLLPIALRDLIPEAIWNVITEVSMFFKDLCSTILQVEQMQKLVENIVVTLCKLEKIFPPGFFDSMEHLPIHLPYEAMVGGPVQYRWMYPFERVLHDLKKMVKNKARVEGSICEAYLMQEISNFCSYYFLPHIETKLSKVGRNDNGGEVTAPDGCLSIFTHPGRASGKMRKRHLSDEEFNAATIYVLLNCVEIEPFLKIFEDELVVENPNITEEEIERKTNNEFAKWLNTYVFDQKNGVLDSRVKYLASSPFREVHTWHQYNVNGYRFHTMAYGSNKTTMNSGVCIKGKCYGDLENDYYELLNDIIELEYHNPSLKRTTLVLFKCDWFDPIINKRWKVRKQFGLVDINHKRRFMKYEPFILAEQSQQVYFAEYASRKKERADWWVVYKVKAGSMIDSPDLVYQEDEVFELIEPDVNDRLDHLSVEIEHEEELVDVQDLNCEIIDDQRHLSCGDTEESEFETQEEDSEEESDENIQYEEEDEESN
ncbi:uncharacterized protein LOC129314536 [Prosopis cineraria]|uniref:uncharacterized protein LOC129314536 n=1 Tax=Prosopis cineraria TaxID=364024 RepID=UPI00240F2671|nr:uncharacterized protein LOC129314536 [Prosopis cineraria]XP_054813975.1 uncharacterized protein LOC129314536 [Prosopis cineraria]XP_054813976.1 uncharacterized protein LOC129314536 [Prosopis cineraria]XP_054813977.1 uncharacterized protein LOC129314536 [Prosopis cineraria]XP_054813978.1 uncharacterized protein LOC129314536 [Prosopis cineraria]XP_054813979.1 uncharacterized protein LOC129314536 [Prosopis cineraria]